MEVVHAGNRRAAPNSAAKAAQKLLRIQKRFAMEVIPAPMFVGLTWGVRARWAVAHAKQRYDLAVLS